MENTKISDYFKIGKSKKSTVTEPNQSKSVKNKKFKMKRLRREIFTKPKSFNITVNNIKTDNPKHYRGYYTIRKFGKR